MLLKMSLVSFLSNRILNVNSKLLLTLVMLIIAGGTFAQTVPGLTYGGTSNESGVALCSDGAGGYVLAGTTRSYGMGSNDVVLVKINQNMIIDWSYTYGTSHNEFVRSIFPTSDGYIISGKSYDKRNHNKAGVYILMVDNEGNVVLEKTYGNESRDIGHSVIESSSGEIIILGYTRTNVPYGAVRILKLNNEGSLLWDKQYGFDRDEYGYEIIEDDDGNYVFAGTRDGFFDDVHGNYRNHDADFWIAKVDTSGNEIFSKSYGGYGHDFGNCIKQVDNGYLYFGSTQSIGEGSFDMSLLFFNTDGDSIWQKTYGGEDFDYGLSMSVNDDGDVFLLGTTASYSIDGSTDIILIKTDILGEKQWELIISGDGDEWGNSVIHTSHGGCLVLGRTNSYGSGGDDLFYTLVSSNGEIETYSDDFENEIGKHLIAPNPTRNYARVNIPEGTNDIFKLNIYSISGVEVRSTEISEYSKQINTSTLESGTYIYKLINTKNDTVISGKLIIY